MYELKLTKIRKSEGDIEIEPQPSEESLQTIEGYKTASISHRFPAYASVDEIVENKTQEILITSSNLIPLEELIKYSVDKESQCNNEHKKINLTGKKSFFPQNLKENKIRIRKVFFFLIPYAVVFLFAVLINYMMQRYEETFCMIHDAKKRKCKIWNQIATILVTMTVYRMGHFAFGALLLYNNRSSKKRTITLIIIYAVFDVSSHFTLILAPIYDDPNDIPFFSIICLLSTISIPFFLILILFMNIFSPLKIFRNYLFFEIFIIALPGATALATNEIFPQILKNIEDKDNYLFILSLLNTIICIVIKKILMISVFHENSLLDVKDMVPGAEMVTEFFNGFKLGTMMQLDEKKPLFWWDLTIFALQKIFENIGLFRKILNAFVIFRKRKKRRSFDTRISFKRHFLSENKMSIVYVLMFICLCNMKYSYLFPSLIYDYKIFDFPYSVEGKAFQEIFNFTKGIAITIFLFLILAATNYMNFRARKKKVFFFFKNRTWFQAFKETLFTFKYFTMFVCGIEMSLIVSGQINKDLIKLFYDVLIQIIKRLRGN